MRDTGTFKLVIIPSLNGMTTFIFEYKPKNCPRCKSHLWDRRYYSYKERGLIAKLTRENYLISFNNVGTYGEKPVYNMPLVLSRFISDIQPNLEELTKVVYIDGVDEMTADMKFGMDSAYKYTNKLYTLMPYCQ